MVFKRRSFGNKKRSHPRRWNLQYGNRPASERPKPTWITTKPRKDKPRGWFF